MRLQWGPVEETLAVIFFALAAYQGSLQDLRLDNVRIQLMCPNQNIVPDEIFVFIGSNLRSLQLWFDNEGVLTSDSQAGQKRVRWFLEQASWLERLSICCMSLEAWKLTIQASPSLRRALESGGPESFCLVPPLHLPCLKMLHVHVHWTTTKHWIGFLEGVSSTLRHLHLGNIFLHEESTGQAAISSALSERCWVLVLKSMQSVLNLQSIEFEGILVGAGGQMFDASAREQFATQSGSKNEPCLKSRIIHWFFNGGHCPLEEASLENNITPLNYLDFDTRWQGDSSWKISWTDAGTES